MTGDFAALDASECCLNGFSFCKIFDHLSEINFKHPNTLCPMVSVPAAWYQKKNANIEKSMSRTDNRWFIEMRMTFLLTCQHHVLRTWISCLPQQISPWSSWSSWPWLSPQQMVSNGWIFYRKIGTRKLVPGNTCEFSSVPTFLVLIWKS